MQTRLLERFLRYVAVTSQSDASQAVVPSTEGQRSLAVSYTHLTLPTIA